MWMLVKTKSAVWNFPSSKVGACRASCTSISETLHLRLLAVVELFRLKCKYVFSVRLIIMYSTNIMWLTTCVFLNFYRIEKGCCLHRLLHKMTNTVKKLFLVKFLPLSPKISGRSKMSLSCTSLYLINEFIKMQYRS